MDEVMIAIVPTSCQVYHQTLVVSVIKLEQFRLFHCQQPLSSFFSTIIADSRAYSMSIDRLLSIAVHEATSWQYEIIVLGGTIVMEKQA